MCRIRSFVITYPRFFRFNEVERTPITTQTMPILYFQCPTVSLQRTSLDPADGDEISHSSTCATVVRDGGIPVAATAINAKNTSASSRRPARESRDDFSDRILSASRPGDALSESADGLAMEDRRGPAWPGGRCAVPRVVAPRCVACAAEFAATQASNHSPYTPLPLMDAYRGARRPA